MLPITVRCKKLCGHGRWLTEIDARGHYTIGKEMVDSVIDRIRRVAGRVHAHTLSIRAKQGQTTAPPSRVSSSSTHSVVVQDLVSVLSFSSVSRPTMARSASSNLPSIPLLASLPLSSSPTTLSSQPTAPLRTPTAHSLLITKLSTTFAVAAWTSLVPIMSISTA
jgi:hypothetical protein